MIAPVAVTIEAVQLAADGAPVGAVGTTEGRRVLVGMFDACGECDVCRRGGAPVCPRGERRTEVAASILASPRWLVGLDDRGGPAVGSAAEGRRGVIDDRGPAVGSAGDGPRGGTAGSLVLPGPSAAAAAGDVALAYTLYARTGVAPRDPVVVTGGDAVARFLVEILLAKGVPPVVVADPTAVAWCAWLASRGAGVARITAATPDADARAAVAEAIAAVAQDPTAARTGGRPWRVIAAGDLARAAALAGPRATLTARADRALGAAAPALPAALAREVTVLGVAGAHPDLVLEAAAMIVKGELDLAAGVTVRRADEPRVADSDRADVITL